MKSFTSAHPVTGAVLWVLWNVVAVASGAPPRLIASILAAGPLVVVPLGLPLLRLEGATAARIVAVVDRALLPAAALAAVSVAISTGAVSALLALPWLAVTGALALAALTSLTEQRTLHPRPQLPAAAAGFLAFAAAWLVISRLDAHPLGLSTAIVEMTALHFHYAGFAAAVITHHVASRAAGASTPVRGVATAISAGVIVSPVMVATGFAVLPAAGLAGAIVYLVVLTALGILTVGVVLPGVRSRPARVLLTISALPLPFTMALGIAYAAGNAFGTAAPTISQMAMWHGIANAAGFVGCGLAGWRLADGDRR